MTEKETLQTESLEIMLPKEKIQALTLLGEASGMTGSCLAKQIIEKFLDKKFEEYQELKSIFDVYQPKPKIETKTTKGN